MSFFSSLHTSGVSRALVRFFPGIPAPGVFTCAFRLSPYGRGFLPSPVLLAAHPLRIAPFSSRTRPLTAVRLLPCPFQGFSLSVA